jgi:lantibiotic modifying enzyme
MAALAACPPMVDLFEIAAKVMRDMPCAPPSRSLCLCHGALGRLEFLQFARDRLRCDGQVTEIEAFQGAILGRIIDGYWVADTAHTLECPSLMVGLAGTGHALLRAALGNRIPSVLALEGPALA